MSDIKKADAGWAKIWGGFETKHPKLAKWLYQIFVYIIIPTVGLSRPKKCSS